MKYLALALILVATPVFASVVNLGNGQYLVGDETHVGLMNEAQKDQYILEQQNEFHNMQVESARALAAKQAEIEQAQTQASKTQANTVITVDEGNY